MSKTKRILGLTLALCLLVNITSFASSVPIDIGIGDPDVIYFGRTITLYEGPSVEASFKDTTYTPAYTLQVPKIKLFIHAFDESSLPPLANHKRVGYFDRSNNFTIVLPSDYYHYKNITKSSIKVDRASLFAAKDALQIDLANSFYWRVNDYWKQFISRELGSNNSIQIRKGTILTLNQKDIPKDTSFATMDYAFHTLNFKATIKGKRPSLFFRSLTGYNTSDITASLDYPVWAKVIRYYNSQGRLIKTTTISQKRNP